MKKNNNTHKDVESKNSETLGKASKCCCDNQLITRRMLFGVIILIVGFGLLFHNMFGWSFNYFWPLTIIAVGLFIIFRRKNE